MAYRQGITIIELLVAIVLLVILMLIAGSIFVTHLKLFRDETNVIAITEENKIALDEITNQIRESQSVVSTCAACGTGTTGSNIIILQIWPLNASGEPEGGNGNFDYIVYKRDAQDTSKITKTVYPHATSTRPPLNKVPSQNVASLTFSYNSATPSLTTEVTIKIKNTITINGKTQDTERESKAVLRNK
jgi:hypothetical protein